MVTNGGMPSRTTSSPLATPNAIPTATARISAAIRLPPLASRIASTTPDKPSTAPIDRSSPSLMMISVIGSASSSRVDDCVPMLRRLGADAKRGSRMVKVIASAARRYPTPGIAAARASSVIFGSGGITSM